jgi:hypothetical protein
MGDNADRENRRADELDRLPALFKEWLGVVGAVGGALAALLAALFPGRDNAAVKVIGYAVALALVGVGVFVFIRVRRRQSARERRERRRAAWEREAPGARLAAFRGLLPYQEGDELPGEHRRLEARRLVTQFAEPTFSFGVVCGDSGCGKTSLLRSAIQSSLKAVGEERGFGVRYLSNPRELSGDAPAGARADAASRLRGELERLRQAAIEAAQGRSLILIIDQFEEFFIEYADPELRLELGRFLDGLIRSSPPVRILCAIRRDYLADMKDLAPTDPDAARNFFEPLSLQGLFTLKNFTVEQAARVVRECAERDRIELDEEFAATLASDLGDGNTVRPPELQLVCAALLGKMTVAEYRLAGGARGILSHHVEDAIEVSGDADTGRRVLRSLCDFPAHAKRDPQTVAEIAAAVGAVGAPSQTLVRTALRRFEGARLVVSERRGAEKERRGGDERRGVGETGYALVHDYLVDAVSKATGDVTTRDEEANQMLAYYVSEYREDPKTRIPFRRLRFIRRHADAKQLADPTARRLLRASVVNLVTSAAALAALVLVTTTLLVAVTTTRRGVWDQKVVGNHWEGNDSGDVKIMVRRGQHLIITVNGTGSDEYEFQSFWKYVKFWDSMTAKLVEKVEGDHLAFIKPDYILSKSDNSEAINAYHIPSKKRFQSALPYFPGLTKSEEGVSSEETQSPSGESIVVSRRGINQPQVNTVFSVVKNTKVQELRMCEIKLGEPRFYVTDDATTLIVYCPDMFGNNERLDAVSVGTGETRNLIRDGYKLEESFNVNRSQSQVATVERASDGQLYVVSWNLRGGGPPQQSLALPQIPPAAKNDITYSRWHAGYTGDDAFIYVTNGGLIPRRVFILRATDLRREQAVPENSYMFFDDSATLDDDKMRISYLAWPNDTEGEAYVWDLKEATPKLLRGLNLPKERWEVFKLIFDAVRDRFLFVRQKESAIELWSLKEGRKLADLAIPGRFDDAQFTLDGEAVSVKLESGTVALYNSRDGGKIAELQNIGGAKNQIYFDRACRRIHVWNDRGRVLRYTEGWYLFGRESWFWPAARCPAQ